MKKLLTIVVSVALATLAGGTSAQAQSFTSTSATGLWNSSRWNHSSDSAPYTSAWVANSNASFASGNFTFSGANSSGAVNIGNITVSTGANVTFSAASGTLSGNGNVRTINVGSGSKIDFSSQAFSVTSRNGWTKSGSGVLALVGGAYNGGFTLNAGTVIARGVDAMGASASNVLTLNGGTVASNGSRSFADTKFGGGIVIGGDVQFGELASIVAIASDSANLSFANNVSLGGATRTFTLGNNGTQTFSAIISNTGSGGITFAANAGAGGRFDITNAANTFTGDININGGEVRFTSNGSLGNAANDIIIDGGRFATASAATYALGAGREIFVGDGAGTAISVTTSGTLTYNGSIADKSGETGSWAKQGAGILELGGASSYTGSTAINQGTVRLTTGNNRLPTGTVVSLGQAASTNLGTLNLGGFNQQIAGLQSTEGTNATASTNVVTSATAATLTINSTSDFTYSAGTAANSGVISGAISLVKEGVGNQTLGGNNTYTGTTTVNGGSLIVAAGARLSGNGTIILNTGGTLAMRSTAALALGTSSIAFNEGTLDIDAGGAVDLANPFSGNGTIRVLSGSLNVAGNTSAFEGGFSIADGLTFSASGAADFSNSTFNLGGSGSTLNFNALASVTIFNITGSGSLIGNSIIIDDPNFDVSNFDVSGVTSLTVVPEPHEYAIMVTAMLGLLIVMRRTRRNGRRS